MPGPAIRSVTLRCPSLLNHRPVLIATLRRFIASGSAPGVVLALAALAALVVSNSPLGDWYRGFVELRSEIRIADGWLVLSKPLLL